MLTGDIQPVGMVRGRLIGYRQRVIDELHRSLVDDPSPTDVAKSFSIGAFITMLPTWGTGLLLFIVLIRLFDWINKIALFASVLVFNPVVKWGVYAASFSIGVLLLGPVDGLSTSEVSLSAGPAIVIRLLLGNLILAVIATVLAYFVAYRVATAYNHSSVLTVVEDALDDLSDEASAD